MPGRQPRKSDYLLLGASGAVFLASLIWGFHLLEADPLPITLSGTAFGDAMAFAQSARVKFLHGVWYRPDLDDWRPVFMVPIHTFLTWLGFSLQGLTLTGLRLFSFVFVTAGKLAALWLLWREFKSIPYLAAGMLLLALYAPINEMSRIGALDSTQLGLFMLTVVCLIAALNKGRRILYLLAGVLCGLTFIFKTSAFLWPLFPYFFIFFRAKLNDRLPKLVAPPPAWDSLHSRGRLAMVYAPTLLLAIDHFITKGQYTFAAAFVSWPLLPTAYFDLNILAGIAQRRASGRQTWRALGFTWLAANVVLMALLLISAITQSPGRALMLLRYLLPLLAAVYFVLHSLVYRGPASLWAGDKKAVIWTHTGLALVGTVSLVFWVIPYLDSILYFSWRMFGPGMSFVSPGQSWLLLNHVLGFLNKAWSPSLEAGILPFHGLWVFGLLGWAMLQSLLRPKFYSDLVVVLLVLLPLFFFQCIFFDLLWHRNYGLMLLGILGLFKLFQAAREWRELAWAEKITPGIALTFGFVFSILTTRYLFLVDFADLEQKFLTLAALTLAGMILAWLVIRLRVKAFALVAALAGLILVPSAVVQSWDYYSKPTYVLRKASQELGRLLGEARVLEFYQYGLYNHIETGYIGNFRGQVKPDGFTWEGQYVPSLRAAVEATQKDSFRAKVLLALDKAYPGFLHRWELPADYEVRYNSKWLVTPHGRASPRFLIIGANEKRVYMTPQAWELYDRFSCSSPALSEEMFELPMAPHMIAESGGSLDTAGKHVIRFYRLATGKDGQDRGSSPSVPITCVIRRHPFNVIEGMDYESRSKKAIKVDRGF